MLNCPKYIVPLIDISASQLMSKADTNTAAEIENSRLRKEIQRLHTDLDTSFKTVFQVTPVLSRKLVSHQANKTQQQYRWYKYKEAFSADLVNYLLTGYEKGFKGTIIDPFAGSGTALFASSELGYSTVGIELLPIGLEIIRTRSKLQSDFPRDEFDRLLFWKNNRPWNDYPKRLAVSTLRITEGAYPKETRPLLEQYLACLTTESPGVQQVLRFALLCVLESISYTRKDGQYLRWDCRAERKNSSKKFQKKTILPFNEAITQKLEEILDDTLYYKDGELFCKDIIRGKVHCIEGSCLNVLPTLASNSYEGLITSPPYCNRYDYTRTYALELALLGVDEQEIINLRQTMLSCTVENRYKPITEQWPQAIAATDQQELLQNILHFLDFELEQGKLNNNGIPRMVRGYFYEMACVIAECLRILVPGAPLFMVNDNVRYAGIEIPVDTILSEIAKTLGFTVEAILVLPTGKGNSSQQMGTHGRQVLRKCVYVWRKPG